MAPRALQDSDDEADSHRASNGDVFREDLPPGADVKAAKDEEEAGMDDEKVETAAAAATQEMAYEAVDVGAQVVGSFKDHDSWLS